MSTLRCLTVKQPWALALIVPFNDKKNVENRSHGASGWRHRGLTVVHAGGGWSERGAADRRVIDLLGVTPVPDDPRFDFMAAIGVADLTDVHPAAQCCEPWGEQKYVQADGTVVHQVTHLVFEDAVMLAHPVSCKGRLGLWRPTRVVEATIEQQLWAARRR